MLTEKEYVAEKFAVEDAVGRTIVEESPPQKGAAWLDEHHPGWAQRIDLNTFNIEDSALCVLGQVFHSEAEGRKHPLLDNDGYDYFLDKYPSLDTTELGFDAETWRATRVNTELAALAIWPDGDTDSHEDPSWAALQAEWRSIIIARQHQ